MSRVEKRERGGCHSIAELPVLTEIAEFVVARINLEALRLCIEFVFTQVPFPGIKSLITAILQGFAQSDFFQRQFGLGAQESLAFGPSDGSPGI